MLAIYTTIDSQQTGVILEAIRNGVIAARHRGVEPKPILLCMMAAATIGPLHAGDEIIPVYPFPEQAARAPVVHARRAGVDWLLCPMSAAVGAG